MAQVCEQSVEGSVLDEGAASSMWEDRQELHGRFPAIVRGKKLRDGASDPSSTTTLQDLRGGGRGGSPLMKQWSTKSGRTKSSRKAEAGHQAQLALCRPRAWFDDPYKAWRVNRANREASGGISEEPFY